MSASVRVVAFARVAELVGRETTLPIGGNARVRDAWESLVARAPALAELEATTRTARNGRIVDRDEPLHDGDELALLPPVGGG